MNLLTIEEIVFSPLNLIRIFVILGFWVCIGQIGQIFFVLWKIKTKNPPRGPMPPIRDIAMLYGVLALLLILLEISRIALVLKNIQPKDYTLVVSLPVIVFLLPPVLNRQIKHYGRILSGFGGKKSVD